METKFLIVLLTFFCLGTSLELRGGGETIRTNKGGKSINVGLIVPHTNFGKREYVKAINNAVGQIQKVRSKFKFLSEYNFAPGNVHYDMMSLTPSPTSKNQS